MPFSWKNLLERTVEHKVRRAKQLAKNGDTEFKLRHADEVRDAQQGKYTVLTTRVKQEVKKTQDEAMNRRRKLVGK